MTYRDREVIAKHRARVRYLEADREVHREAGATPWMLSVLDRAIEREKASLARVR